MLSEADCICLKALTGGGSDYLGAEGSSGMGEPDSRGLMDLNSILGGGLADGMYPKVRGGGMMGAIVPSDPMEDNIGTVVGGDFSAIYTPPLNKYIDRSFSGNMGQISDVLSNCSDPVSLLFAVKDPFKNFTGDIRLRDILKCNIVDSLKAFKSDGVNSFGTPEQCWRLDKSLLSKMAGATRRTEDATIFTPSLFIAKHLIGTYLDISITSGTLISDKLAVITGNIIDQACIKDTSLHSKPPKAYRSGMEEFKEVLKYLATLLVKYVNGSGITSPNKYNGMRYYQRSDVEDVGDNTDYIPELLFDSRGNVNLLQLDNMIRLQQTRLTRTTESAPYTRGAAPARPGKFDCLKNLGLNIDAREIPATLAQGREYEPNAINHSGETPNLDSFNKCKFVNEKTIKDDLPSLQEMYWTSYQLLRVYNQYLAEIFEAGGKDGKNIDRGTKAVKLALGLYPSPEAFQPSASQVEGMPPQQYWLKPGVLLNVYYTVLKILGTQPCLSRPNPKQRPSASRPVPGDAAPKFNYTPGTTPSSCLATVGLRTRLLGTAHDAVYQISPHNTDNGGANDIFPVGLGYTNVAGVDLGGNRYSGGNDQDMYSIYPPLVAPNYKSYTEATIPNTGGSRTSTHSGWTCMGVGMLMS